MLLTVKNVEKRYRLHGGALSRFVDLASFGLVTRHRPFQALFPLSFDLKHGEALAVIGANGSGKTTLARLVAGISPATAGSLEVKGRAAGLLGLGTGFHPDFTGEQNVRIAARLLGVPTNEIEARLRETLDFAEIGTFAKQSMRTYSAGMVARLGFAVLTAIRPDLFILDEAFSAGDLYFHRKCWERLQRMKDEGMGFLIVTHNLDLARLFCDRSLWLHEGVLRELGPTEDVCLAYESFHRERPIQGETSKLSPEEGLRIRSLDFLDENGKTQETFPSGSSVRIALDWESGKIISEVVFGITIHDEKGALLWGANNHDLGPGPFSLPAGRGRVLLDLSCHALAPGRYRITATAHEKPAAPLWGNPDDFHYQRWDFRILPSPCREGSAVGPVRLNGSWKRTESS